MTIIQVLFQYLQGPFALCRVIKRKDNISSRTSDLNGGTAFKQVECSSRIEGFTSTVALNEPLVLSDDMPTPATYVSGNSNYSTPINSPYQTTQIEDYDSANLWMSQNMVLDPSKVLMLFLFLCIGSCFFL